MITTFKIFVRRRISFRIFLYVVIVLLCITYITRPQRKTKKEFKHSINWYHLTNNSIIMTDKQNHNFDLHTGEPDSNFLPGFLLQPLDDQSCQKTTINARLSKPDKNPNVYSKYKNLVIVLVHSDAHHFENRKVIRQTWGKSISGESKLVFLLGNPQNETCQAHISDESLKFNDVLQGNFYETYRNITLKALMGLKWLSQECPNTEYFLKVDDDMFVDSPRIISGMKKQQIPKRNLLMCKPILNAPVLRRGKYAVPRSLYPLQRWPKFCFGGAWIASVDVIIKLYRASATIPQVHLDDVYVTGILRTKINQPMARLVVDGGFSVTRCSVRSSSRPGGRTSCRESTESAKSGTVVTTDASSAP